MIDRLGEINNSYGRDPSILFLWAGVIFAGFFLMLSSTFTMFLILPIYLISLYSAFRYTTSPIFTARVKNKIYLRDACIGLISVIFLSIFIAMFNPVAQHTSPDGFPAYSKVSSYQQINDRVETGRVGIPSTTKDR